MAGASAAAPATCTHPILFADFDWSHVESAQD
jgi:hypothetical protein